MPKVKVEKIETQSPLIKLVRLKTEGNFLKKSKQKSFFFPGQTIKLSVWGYGQKEFALASSPYENQFLDIITSKGSILEEILHQLDRNEIIQISLPQGNGLPLKELEYQDILFVTDNIGIATAASFIHYLSKKRKRFGQVALIYSINDYSEMIFKDKIKDWQQNAYVATISGSSTLKTEQIPLNPLLSKAMLCVKPEKVKSALENLVKPLGISHQNIFIWNSGNVEPLTKIAQS